MAANGTLTKFSLNKLCLSLIRGCVSSRRSNEKQLHRHQLQKVNDELEKSKADRDELKKRVTKLEVENRRTVDQIKQQQLRNELEAERTQSADRFELLETNKQRSQTQLNESKELIEEL